MNAAYTNGTMVETVDGLAVVEGANSKFHRTSTLYTVRNVKTGSVTRESSYALVTVSTELEMVNRLSRAIAKCIR